MNEDKHFFHADTEKYSYILCKILINVIIPLIALCVFCTVNIVLNYRSPAALMLMIIIAGSVLFGMIFTFMTVYIIEKRKRRHARYTFLDFLPEGMIYSEYAGEFIRYDDRIVLRRLYLIPFEKLEDVSRDPKKAPRDIIFKGEIHEYFLDSDRLGYHVNDDGYPIFDTDILNYGYCNISDALIIKNRLGNTKRIEKSALYYWDKFKNKPEKEEFDIKKFVSTPKKHKLKTSNAALEKPSFNRSWK